MARISAARIAAKAVDEQTIVCITAYDAPTAGLVEAAGVDLVLVGDSVGNVVLGFPDTRHVSLEMTIHHTAAVMRGTQHVHVCADMPFGTYQPSAEDAKRSVARLIRETGCQSVKLEGGRQWYKTVRAIVEMGIPVMGHLGHLPQTAGLRPKREHWSEERTTGFVEEAVGLQDAGAYAIVLEVVPTEVARATTEALDVPTIGIGSGPHCDGQVLVLHDVIGLGPELPHAKRYAEVGDTIRAAVSQYAAEVREGVFPGPEHGYD